MTVSMRVMSAGDGCKYLLRTVAAGDGDRSLDTPLTRYYNADGTPPGAIQAEIWSRPGAPRIEITRSSRLFRALAAPSRRLLRSAADIAGPREIACRNRPFCEGT